jgi:hypothetical protein
MPSPTDLNCPVCRAKQTSQSECRRCGADLSLLIKALRSVQAAQRQVEQAQRRGDADFEDALAYLRWLSPAAARAIVGAPLTEEQAD